MNDSRQSRVAVEIAASFVLWVTTFTTEGFAQNIAPELRERLTSADRLERIEAIRQVAKLEEIGVADISEIVTFAKSEITSIIHADVAVDVIKNLQRLPLQGDEVSLLRIKANPDQYIDKKFYLCGVMAIDDYWNYGYGRAEKSHYSIELNEVAQDLTPKFSGVHVYLDRKTGGGIVEAITKQQEKNPERVFARVLVTIPKDRYEGPDTWDLMELLDVQFLSLGASKDTTCGRFKRYQGVRSEGVF